TSARGGAVRVGRGSLSDTRHTPSDIPASRGDDPPVAGPGRKPARGAGSAAEPTERNRLTFGSVELAYADASLARIRCDAGEARIDPAVSCGELRRAAEPSVRTRRVVERES